MRKAQPKKIPLAPDPRFNDVQVTRFINNIMLDGKKTTAFKIFYDAIEQVEKNTGDNGVDLWKKALNNVMPTVEVKARRVGGSTFQIPTEVQPRRRMAVGMKWMIGYARKRNEKSMAEKLAGEILAAARNEGFTQVELMGTMAGAAVGAVAGTMAGRLCTSGL